MNNIQNQSKLTKTYSQTSNSSYIDKEDPVFDIEDELTKFVQTIEQNTFSILSIKQKFGLMKKNGEEFKKESIGKLDSLISTIDELDKNITKTLNEYNSRLDLMETLTFQPSSLHPIQTISISDSHKISSVAMASDFLFIGTENSSVLVYDLKNKQMFCEMGPLDSHPIVDIGIMQYTEYPIVVAYTQTGNIHICDSKNTSDHHSINGKHFCTWPSNLSCQFSLAVLMEEETRFYKNSLDEFQVISITGNFAGCGVDKIVLAQDKSAVVVDLEATPKEKCVIEFKYQILHITVSRAFFCVAGADCISICNFETVTRVINTDKYPTKFLISYELFLFRVMENSHVIEVHDSLGNNPVTYIGSSEWSPHEANKSPSAVCMYNSILCTAKDSTCVMWS